MSAFSSNSSSFLVTYPAMYTSTDFVSSGTDSSSLATLSIVSQAFSSECTLYVQSAHAWPLSWAAKTSQSTSRESKSFALLMFDFSMICWTLMKYAPPAPWRSFPNSFYKVKTSVNINNVINTTSDSIFHSLLFNNILLTTKLKA